MSKVLSKETSPYFKTMSGLILNQKETLAKRILDEERFDYSHLGNNRSRLEHLRMKLIICIERPYRFHQLSLLKG